MSSSLERSNRSATWLKSRWMEQLSTSFLFVAVALVVGLTATRIFPESGKRGPYVLFAISIVISSVRAGVWSGIVATLLSVLATAFFELEPRYSLRVSEPDDLSLLLLFLLEGVVLSASSASISLRVDRPDRTWIERIVAATVFVVACTLAKLFLETTISPVAAPFILFYAAVMCAAWYGGPVAGLIATVMAAASAAFFFFEPRYSFRINEAYLAGQMILFVIEGGVICQFSESLRRAQLKTVEASTEAFQYLAELRESERRLRRQNQALVDVARQRNEKVETWDFARSTRELTEVGATTLEVERASIWLFSEDRRSLRCIDLFERSVQRHSRDQQLELAAFPAYFAAANENRTIAAGAAAIDPRTREFTKSYLEPLGIGAMLDAPIRFGGSVVGIVCFEHVGAVRDWKVDEEQFAGSVADIVALTLKRAELRQADERIREQASLLDQARDAIMVVGLDGTIRYWNKGAEAIFGWSSSEAVGKDGDALLGRGKSLIEDRDIALTQHGDWDNEAVFRDRIGRELKLAVRWTVVHGPNGPSGRMMIGTDITERSMMEQKLLRAQRLESIGVLASGIAHDLNNLLTPLLMGTELLHGAKEGPDRDSILEAMKSSAERAASLLQNILTFARGSSESTAPVDVRSVVRLVADMLGHTLPKNIRLRTNVQPEVRPLPGPASKIDQLLMNLCVNARDAMPNGGQLVLAVENDDQGMVAGHSDSAVVPFVRITVSDTGTGIPPEIINRIFDPFFTTKEPGKGTGLGLATTLGIVHALGGSINVDSQVGEGTRFTIRLPAKVNSGVAKKTDSKEMPVGSGEMILVIDDEVSLCQLVRRALETYGYRVSTASSGEEGVARCHDLNDELRVVVIDQMMPGQDLRVTLKQIRVVCPRAPIILATGAESTSIEGVDGELRKPFSIPQLLRELRRMIAQAPMN